MVTYSASRKSRKTTFGVFTWLMSAAAGYPAALTAPLIASSKAALWTSKSTFARIEPLKEGTTVVEPTFTVAIVPAGAGSFRYGMAFFASQPFATSHDDVNLRLPIGSNWNEQSSSEATTVTGLFVCASKIAGFAAFVSCLKIGK